MIVARSISTDPHFNLELERTLLEDCEESYMLLYINSPSVIVGRNQSPGAEADTDWCAARGIPVIRRISGGGTVWHDEGNINYAMITPRTCVPPLDVDPTAPVVAALASMGVCAETGCRGELTVEGMKISGAASRVTATRQLFHGTLLHSADLASMERALRGDPARRGKMIASVPSPVRNLAPLVGGTAKEFLDRLVDFFMIHLGEGQKAVEIYDKAL